MADKINDGGPAFPQPDLSGQGIGPNDRGMEGMTLRDYFAGQALPLVARMEYTRGNKFIAECAYALADEMLKARTKRAT